MVNDYRTWGYIAYSLSQNCGTVPFLIYTIWCCQIGGWVTTFDWFYCLDFLCKWGDEYSWIPAKGIQFWGCLSEYKDYPRFYVARVFLHHLPVVKLLKYCSGWPGGTDGMIVEKQDHCFPFWYHGYLSFKRWSDLYVLLSFFPNGRSSGISPTGPPKQLEAGPNTGMLAMHLGFRDD